MKTFDFRVFTLDNREEIKKILAHFPRGDVHYDPRYLQLFQNYTGEKAIYFYYQCQTGEIILPFFERLLSDQDSSGSVYKDLVSPWYYGGPLHNFSDLDSAQTRSAHFLNKFDQYCLENNIISEFQRLNPILANHQFYGNSSQVKLDRKVVYIDLAKDLELIRKEYLYKAKKNINKARRSGLKVRCSKDEKSINQFLEVYHSAMQRKNARDFYYFNPEFFRSMFRDMGEESEIFTAYERDKVVASSVVLGNGNILHDYLRAAYPEHLDFRPNDVMIDEIISWAKLAGYKYYVLGGGLSGADDDTLMQFKSSFSPDKKDLFLYKKIHNLAKYNEFCIASGKLAGELKHEQARPFPEYKTS